MAYFNQMKRQKDYWNYSNKDLDDALGKFMFPDRNQQGQHYKVNSLKYIRHSLKKKLQKKNKIDTVTHPNFTDM